MRECPHCRRPLSNTLSECPECGAPLDDSTVATHRGERGAAAHQPFAPIARFANVAEAGYFHCELEGQLECEVRLTTQNHFDAPTASWWSNYVLTVPAANAEQATMVLKQLVSETDQTEVTEFGDEPLIPSDRNIDELPDGESRIHWTPIILTLTAGTFVVWAAKEVHRHLREPVGRQAKQMDIWDQLGSDGSPWVQTVNGGRGRRELLIDRVTKIATLREDTDGDGVIDRKTRITLAPAGR